MAFGWHLHRKHKSPNSIYLTKPYVGNISHENPKSEWGRKVRIMWHFQHLSSGKGCVEAMANIISEHDGKVRKTLSYTNWPDRFNGPTQSHAWRATGGWATFHCVIFFHPEVSPASLLGRPCSSTQARLTVPNPDRVPGTPPRIVPATREVLGGLGDRLASSQATVIMFPSGRLWSHITASLGVPKGEIWFWTQYQK